MNTAEEVIGKLTSAWAKQSKERSQFIRDVLDDYQARKVDMDKAVVAINNITLELLDAVISELRSQAVAPTTATAVSPAVRAAGIFNAKPVATKSQEQLSLDDFEIK